MNERAYISKGVTTRSNFFDGTVQLGQSFERQLVQDSRTTSNRSPRSDERVRDAAAQCDIGKTEEYEMLSLPTFTYPELMSQPGNIRLLTLQPALYFWSPIRCSLFNTSIAEEGHLDYKALSYTWKKDGASDDDDDELHAIILNGRILHIGGNLMDALRRLRHKTEPQVWWVDAICINQMDNSDRSFQVHYMRQVYEKAKKVVVWLGEETDLTGTAIKTFEWIGQLNAAGTSKPRKLRASESRGCSQLLTHSWWKRVWIIQEVSLSGNVHIQCGGYNFNWTLIENFGKVAHVSYEGWYDLAKQIAGWHQSRILVDYRYRTRKGPLPTLVEFLHSARYFHASDVRDKLYALLGISSQTYGVTPNYELSVPEVFTKLARDIIVQTGTLDILSQVQRKPCLSGERRTSELPSWVPNWGPHEVRTTDLVQGPSPPLMAAPLYIASGPWQAEAQFSPCGKKLYLFGISADRISKCGQPSGYDADVPPFASWKAIAGCSAGGPNYSGFPPIKCHHSPGTNISNCENCKKLTINSSRADPFHQSFSQTPQYVAGGSKKAAYWRTIFADRKIVKNEEKRLRDTGQDQALPFSGDTSEEQDSKFETAMISDLIFHLTAACFGRAFFRTSRGYFGLGPPDSQPDDIVCIFPGAAVPYIVRARGDDYVLVGESYVHGMMDGEIMTAWVRGDWENKGLQAKTFTLI